MTAMIRAAPRAFGQAANREPGSRRHRGAERNSSQRVRPSSSTQASSWIAFELAYSVDSTPALSVYRGMQSFVPCQKCNESRE